MCTVCEPGNQRSALVLVSVVTHSEAQSLLVGNTRWILPLFARSLCRGLSVFLAFASWNWSCCQAFTIKLHRQCQCPYECDRCPHIHQQSTISEEFVNVGLFFFPSWCCYECDFSLNTKIWPQSFSSMWHIELLTVNMPGKIIIYSFTCFIINFYSGYFGDIFVT